MNQNTPTKLDLQQACNTASKSVADLQAMTAVVLGPEPQDMSTPAPRVSNEDRTALLRQREDTRKAIFQPFEELARRQRLAEKAPPEPISAPLERVRTNYRKLCDKLGAQELEATIGDIRQAFTQLEKRVNDALGGGERM